MPTAHDYHFHILADFTAVARAYTTTEAVAAGQIKTQSGWWHGTVVERRSLAGELSLSCA